MHIQFLGAAETVTGSKYLIKADQLVILLDCGLFQGRKGLRQLNWHALPFDAKKIDYVLLSHAHIDHSGYIPLLIKHGFKGKIICTEASRDLCALLLPDSGHLHEEEARYANQKGYAKHQPALPLYTFQEAEKSLEYFKVIKTGKLYHLNDNFKFEFHAAGHILGASSISISHYDSTLLFSGDLGRKTDPIFYPPVKPQKTDYLIIESTYGDRLHSTVDCLTELEEIIKRTIRRGGTILMPAFAVGRAQLLLYYLHELISTDRIPNIPVFVNSPMATNATKLFFNHKRLHKLSDEQTIAVCKTARYINSLEESMQLDTNPMPKVIISASGMATGGRVLHHIYHLAPDHRNAIVFCGFQAPSTRGDKMTSGATHVKVHGQEIPIKAEVINLDGLSAHADYQELLEWLGNLSQPPRKVFITHGELQSAMSLKEKIESKFGWQCEVPKFMSDYELI